MAALCLACALGAAPIAAEGPAAAGGAETIGGSLSSTLYEDSLALRLGLGRGPSYLGLGLDSSEDGAFLEGCLFLAADREGGPSLAAGPGSASGSLRLLADPASTTALSMGAPVALDRSLESRTAVLDLQAGPLSLFGIAGGRGPIAFASKARGEERSMGAVAGGFSLGIARDAYRIEALTAASYAKPAAPSSGWQPDAYASPALNSCGAGEPLAEAALLVERSGKEGGALAALSGSYGALAGPALAFRLQARETVGPLDLRIRAAAASPGFRVLFGAPERRLAGAAAEARLAMRRASSVSVSAEAEAAGQGLRYAPSWGESAAVKLVLPLGIETVGAVESRLEARFPAEGERGGSCAFAYGRGEAEEGGQARVEARLDWGRAVEGLELALSTEAAARGGLPSLCLDLGLELFDGGRASSPVLAKGGLGLALPCGLGGFLELDVDLPEAGVALEPRAAPPGGPAPTELAFRLRYKASFSVSTRRPRSRRSTGPKASSIAQRAAS
jgi:hypothetical protein